MAFIRLQIVDFGSFNNLIRPGYGSDPRRPDPTKKALIRLDPDPQSLVSCAAVSLKVVQIGNRVFSVYFSYFREDGGSKYQYVRQASAANRLKIYFPSPVLTK
jgi:hypothetical protein